MNQWAIQFSEVSPDSCKNIIQKKKKKMLKTTQINKTIMELMQLSWNLLHGGTSWTLSSYFAPFA